LTHNAAGSSPDTIQLKGIGVNASIGIDPFNVSFGNINVGANLEKIIRITNNSDVTPLVVSSFNISPSVFTLPNNDSTITLRPRENYSLRVKFLPTDAIDYSGTLKFNHNAAGSPTSIPLTGTGTRADISIVPQSMDFGNVLVYSSSTKTVKIVNSGNMDLVVSSLSVIGANQDLFSASFAVGLPITIRPSDSAIIAVQFIPNSSGGKSAQLNIGHSASSIPATMIVTGNGASPLISLNPSDNVDFGNISVNSTSNNYITVSNLGTASLTIIALQITGQDEQMFKRVFYTGSEQSENITIDPGKQVVFAFSFTPSSAGAKKAKVVFIHSMGTSEVNFTGGGLISGISAAPHPLEFGNVNIGSFKNLPVVIANTGNVALRVTNFEITGADAFLFSRYSNPDSFGVSFTLDPYSTYTIMVRFRPDLSGYKIASLKVISDVGSATVSLVGNVPTIINPEPPQEISVDDPEDVSGETFLFHSNPNPVKSGYEVSIKYRINLAGEVNLIVYDLLGREVTKLVNGYKPQGLYTINFNTKNLTSGMYFYRLRAPGYEGIKKMIIIR